MKDRTRRLSFDEWSAERQDSYYTSEAFSANDGYIEHLEGRVANLESIRILDDEHFDALLEDHGALELRVIELEEVLEDIRAYTLDNKILFAIDRVLSFTDNEVDDSEEDFKANSGVEVGSGSSGVEVDGGSSGVEADGGSSGVEADGAGRDDNGGDRS